MFFENDVVPSEVVEGLSFFATSVAGDIAWLWLWLLLSVALEVVVSWLWLCGRFGGSLVLGVRREEGLR